MQGTEDTLNTERLVKMLDRIIAKGMKVSYNIYDNPGNRRIVSAGLLRMKELFAVYGGCSEMRITDFVVYQIYRYRDMIAEWPRGSWTLSWCFGETAVEKYRQQFMSEDGKRGMNYYIDKWLSDMGLSREMLSDMLSEKRERGGKYICLTGEDATKRRFLNKPSGMMLCLASTTGWTPQSPVCKECRCSSECMERTERKYPEITRLRKEEQDRNK